MNFFADGRAKANSKLDTRWIVMKGSARANAMKTDVPVINGMKEFINISKINVPINAIVMTSR